MMQIATTFSKKIIAYSILHYLPVQINKQTNKRKKQKQKQKFKNMFLSKNCRSCSQTRNRMKKMLLDNQLCNFVVIN